MPYERHLILEPRELWWERRGVFNPAAIELEGKVNLLYRAVGGDGISRFGLALSADGLHFQRFDKPVFEGDENNIYERLGVEDPRVVAIDKDLFITYTAASVYPINKQHSMTANINPAKTPWRLRVSALKTRDVRRFEKIGVILPNLDSKNASFFPRKIQQKYWLIHRINQSIYLSTSPTIKRWEGGLELMQPRRPWEQLKIGAACPPLETEHGWLLFYHGVSKQRVYSIGVALLALENPSLVLSRSQEPLLTPKVAWEKRGEVSNVVFVTGAIARKDEYWLYYGAADRVIGMTKIPKKEIWPLLSRS